MARAWRSAPWIASALLGCPEQETTVATVESPPQDMQPIEPVRLEPIASLDPPEVASGDPTVVFSDPRLLERWDADARAPLSLATILRRIHADAGLPLPDLPAAGPSSGDVLGTYPATWNEIAAQLQRDIDRIVRELDIDWEDDITRTYDVDAAKTEIGRDRFHRGNGNVARVLRPRWLTSPDGQFLLAGALYRPDRKDFAPDTCGELRLLYRLAYEVEMGGRIYASRMPFTVNVVFDVPDDGAACRRVAARWRSETVTDDNAATVADGLLAGPLDLDRVRFRQIELDAQIVRFPSDLENVENRRFAGQALYWLRIFALADGRLHPIPLENTPDVLAIRRDPSKRAALLDFVASNLAAIDTGVFRVPDELLADIALSWSTLGSARLANRPFASLIERAEADAIVARAPDAARSFVVDGASLLERLDNASCMGCHQSSSTAGFHFLGVDRRFGDDPNTVVAATDGNRLQLAFSPHFRAEIDRRTAYVQRLAAGEPPPVVRPHPSAPPAQWDGDAPRYAAATSNMPCPLSSIGAASSWSCADGLTCREVARDPSLGFSLGQCVPSEDRITAGLSCRAAVLEASTEAGADLIAWNVRSFADRVVDERPLYAITDGAITQRTYNCRPSRIGVPLGRVTRNCRSDERTLAAFDGEPPAEACAIVGGKGFEEMAKGYFDSRAFAAGVGRGLLDTCTPDRFCREDYICQQLPDFLAAGRGVEPSILARAHERSVGFCTPTYFVYQLRLDGHPNPR